MKTKTLKWVAMLLMLVGSFTSCEEKEKQAVLKILQEEPGYIVWHSMAAVDRVCYIIFEPTNPHANLTSQFLLYKGSNPLEGEKFEKYYDKLVKVSGKVTNRVEEFEDYGTDSIGNSIRVSHKYHILDLSSIEFANQ